MYATARQRLDQWTRNVSPIVTTLFLVLLGLVPLHIPYYGPIAPVLPIVAIYYWTLHRPDLFPFSAAFAVGLLQDLLTGHPPGGHALVFLLLRALLVGQRRFLQGKTYLIIWWGFFMTVVFCLLALWLIYSVYFGMLLPVRPLIYQLMLTVAVFPPLSWLLYHVQRSLLAPHQGAAPG